MDWMGWLRTSVETLKFRGPRMKQETYASTFVARLKSPFTNYPEQPKQQSQATDDK